MCLTTGRNPYSQLSNTFPCLFLKIHSYITHVECVSLKTNGGMCLIIGYKVREKNVNMTTVSSNYFFIRNDLDYTRLVAPQVLAPTVL